MTLQARLWTAVLSTGGALGFTSAAHDWGMVETPGAQIDIVLGHDRRVTIPAGVRVLRVVPLRPHTVQTLNGLPITTRTASAIDHLSRLRFGGRGPLHRPRPAAVVVDARGPRPATAHRAGPTWQRTHPPGAGALRGRGCCRLGTPAARVAATSRAARVGGQPPRTDRSGHVGRARRRLPVRPACHRGRRLGLPLRRRSVSGRPHQTERPRVRSAGRCCASPGPTSPNDPSSPGSDRPPGRPSQLIGESCGAGPRTTLPDSRGRARGVRAGRSGGRTGATPGGCASGVGTPLACRSRQIGRCHVVSWIDGTTWTYLGRCSGGSEPSAPSRSLEDSSAPSRSVTAATITAASPSGTP